MAHKPVPNVLPKMVVNIKIVNTPTMVRYITHSSDVLGKTLVKYRVITTWLTNLYLTFYHK